MPGCMRTMALAAALVTAMGATAMAAAAEQPRLLKGDPAVCAPLMERLAGAEIIAPLITSRAEDLRIGEFEDARLRIYVTPKELPADEFLQRVLQRDWIGLLGEVPPDAETTPATIYNAPGLRPYLARCPQLLSTGSSRDGVLSNAPHWIAVLEADIDNDGTPDTLVQRWRTFNRTLDLVDLDACALRTVEGAGGSQKIILFRIDGAVYVANRSRDHTDIYLNPRARHPAQYDSPICRIGGVVPLGGLPYDASHPFSRP